MKLKYEAVTGRAQSHSHFLLCVHRLVDVGSVSQTLSVFMPVRKKHTSSHPATSSKPHSLMHLAVATNTVVGVLSTSQTSLDR